jgi:hypothetical protein
MSGGQSGRGRFCPAALFPPILAIPGAAPFRRITIGTFHPISTRQSGGHGRHQLHQQFELGLIEAGANQRTSNSVQVASLIRRHGTSRH